MPKREVTPQTDVQMIENRVILMNVRLQSLDNSLLTLGNEIAFIKHKIATIQSQYAVGVRETKKHSNLTPEELLKDLLRGKTNIDVTSWFDGNPDKTVSSEDSKSDNKANDISDSERTSTNKVNRTSD